MKPIQLFTTWLLFLFAPACIAQQVKLSGKILSAGDKLPVPYVNILAVKAARYTDADSTGAFSIVTERTDSLVFACIGYETIRIAAMSLLENQGPILLKPRVNDLGTVVVGKSSPLRIGCVDKKQTRSFVGETQSDSYEMATLITVPDTTRSFRISRVYFRQKNFFPERVLRLHIYAVDKNGLPGEELLKHQVIVSEKDHSKGMLSIDVKSQNIIVEGASFFVGLQWITQLTNELPKGHRNDVGLGETSVLPEKLTYRRGHVLEYRWYVLYEKGVAMAPVKDEKSVQMSVQGNPLNLLASADIEMF